MLSILDPKWYIFIRVAELGSLTRAANVMDVPQSLISRNIASLENQCNARLFRRTGRGVVLTEFGEQILPRIRTLVNDAELLSDDVVASRGDPVGEVRIGLLPTTVSLMGGWLFRRVKELYPMISLHMCEGPSTQLEEQLNEGRIDMALLLREGCHAEEKIISQLKLRLIGPAGDPIFKADQVSLEQVASLSLVVPSRPHTLRRLLDKLEKDRSLSFNCAIEADSINLQHEVVAVGGGYAISSGILNHSRVDERIASAVICDPELVRSVVLSSTLRRPATLATRKVEKLIEQEAPAILDAS